MLCYCKKCGRIVLCNDSDEQCDYCLSIIYPVPDEYLGGKSKGFIKKDLKEQFINEYIKSSPEFDQYLFDHRDEILAKQSAEFNAKMEHGKAVLEEQSRTPKCPICGSFNLSKITTTKKVMKIAAFGIFGMGDNGKTWKCENCGSKF